MCSGRKNKKACDPLIARMQDENRDVRRRRQSPSGRSRTSALWSLSSRRCRMRINSARRGDNRAREIRDKRSVAPLIKALRDKDWGVRWGVANALGEQTDPVAIDPLISALDDEVRYVREGAASALQRIGKPAVKKLIESLQDPSPNVRRWSAWTLGKIKDQRAAKGLINALQDKDTGCSSPPK